MIIDITMKEAVERRHFIICDRSCMSRRVVHFFLKPIGWYWYNRTLLECLQLIINILIYRMRSVRNCFFFLECCRDNNNIVIVTFMIFVKKKYNNMYDTKLSRHMLIIASHPKRWPTLLCRVVYLYLHSTILQQRALMQRPIS